MSDLNCTVAICISALLLAYAVWNVTRGYHRHLAMAFFFPAYIVSALGMASGVYLMYFSFLG